MTEVVLNKKTLNKIGNQLWDLRSTKNISQKELGKRINKKQSVISEMESNKRLPSLRSMIDYLDAFGLQLVAVKKSK